MDGRDGISNFVDQAASAFSTHDSDIARSAGPELRLPAPSPGLSPKWMPACEALRTLDANDDPLLNALVACAGDLHWKTPAFGHLPLGVSSKMAVCEVIGPDGMFPRADFRFGVLLQGAGVAYPSHRHAAAELYLILAGTADWQIGDGDFHAKAPGTFVRHGSMQPHAMRTADQAMIAIWVWVGDVAASTYTVDPRAKDPA